MSIIATVGRRSFGVMVLIGSMYVLLTAGGISMVYPFLLMLSTATTTQNDMQEYEVVPRYYYDDNALYRKYLWLRYDTGLGGATAKDYNRAYCVGDPNRPAARLGGPAVVSSFRMDEYFGWGEPEDPAARGVALPPGVDADDPAVRRRAADLDRFLKESAVLWPGAPLTETIDSTGQGGTVDRPHRVTDPYGRPLDPYGLSTGLGNRYRTVGYIGTIYIGFSGPGRDEWTRFVEQFYTNPDQPDEPEKDKISRLMKRHGRPYQRFKQVRPGYDMPTTPSWAIIEGEYLQTDWLFYKAVWPSGAPIVRDPDDLSPASLRPGTAPPGGPQSPYIAIGGPGPVGITPAEARATGQPPDGVETYADVLGRTHRWTKAQELRALRPSLLMPDFWTDLSNRYPSVDQFNLAIGLARQEWPETPEPDPSESTASGEAKGKPTIEPTGRDVLRARTLNLTSLGGPAEVPEPAWVAALRAGLVPTSPRDQPGHPASSIQHPGPTTPPTGPPIATHCDWGPPIATCSHRGSTRTGPS